LSVWWGPYELNPRGGITMDTRTDHILGNIAKELSTLADVADNIDRICAEIVPDSCVLLESQSHGLQSVDLLRQTLECLSFLVDNLADQNSLANEVPIASLTKNIYLGRIREICVSSAGKAQPAQSHADSEVTLF